MFDISNILEALSAERPVFHSEADFQHALAWKIHENSQEVDIRLEFKPPNLNKRVFLDVWARDGKSQFAMELKYKTRRLPVRVNGEDFDLQDQSAQDLGRYDFLKDVQRLEGIVLDREGLTGCAILLTNDSAYWSPPRHDRSVDASFRIHQGRVVTGELCWGLRASKGTVLGREDPIIIRGNYRLGWRNYSQPSQVSYGKLRYLLIKVGEGPVRSLGLGVS
ncbi:MAG: hypothetical protein GTO24_15435 [candidate division Zixibacteria bacterium]|nr:hypothetical protein [candidate division Zixibacteria bacterium]